ncbi:hypothetical protein AAHZ94_21140 [Streptomyces sp. HSW2009]|uniref:hypothetical protein n=1 Tax=Streptomyces sp. HSW2009 TaxID=3142890 RepID=UPI0032EAB23E
MPLTTTSPDPTGPRRRSLLAIAGGAVGISGIGTLLTGCSDDSRDTAASDGRTSADARLRSEAARASAALLVRYDATISAHPALANRLRPLRGEVARHAAAFGSPAPSASATAPAAPSAAAARPESPKAAASPRAGGATSGAPRTDDVPRNPRAALTTLASAERRTADTQLAALTTASPELARLLASVAASSAAHAYLLAESRT